VTTEKDAVNLCETSSELVAPLTLYWLQIGMKIDREEELIEEIEEHLLAADKRR
jgi:hypothetical protein